MKDDAPPVRLYLSERFSAKVGKYMSGHEREAFYQHLVRNPLLGEPIPEAPGCLVIEWMNGQIYIRYTVSDDHSALFLISISSQSEMEVNNQDRGRISGLMDTIIKSGIGAAVKSLIDYLMDRL